MKCEWHGLGVMSGTSLDGLDLAVCKFVKKDSHWTYDIEDAITIAYPKTIVEKLVSATQMAAIDYALLDVELGTFFANSIKTIIG